MACAMHMLKLEYTPDPEIISQVKGNATFTGVISLSTVWVKCPLCYTSALLNPRLRVIVWHP